jgi:hypothetical protein
MERQALRDAWLTLLGRWEWDGVYLTCRDFGHHEAADKCFLVLISQANRVLFGVRWSKQGRGLRWVSALEYQKRDVIHYHTLIAGVQDLRRLYWMDRWYELAGIARIEPIDAPDAVVRYVSKYVVKGGRDRPGRSAYACRAAPVPPGSFPARWSREGK